MATTSSDRLLIVQVAALGFDLVNEFPDIADKLEVQFQPLEPEFPAVTCTSQATLRTALSPSEHGIVCNGLFNRSQSVVDFWNQSARLLPQERFWRDFRQSGARVGTVCYQQSLGDPEVDLVLSPAPIHKHSGGIIQDCYSIPGDLYKNLCGRIGRPFNLFHYWGPFSSIKSTRWIRQATTEIMNDKSLAPELLFTYFPHLDYALQKYGPRNIKKTRNALRDVIAELRALVDAARDAGYEVVIAGDYAISDAEQVVLPNRILREAGIFYTRSLRGKTYADLYSTPAFAMVDHQMAHVFIRDSSREKKEEVMELFRDKPGIATVTEGRDLLDHPNSGEIVLVASPGSWFAYPWWDEKGESPDYAGHIDIHNKIGFDPCELFLENVFPLRVTQDTSKVKGTHGRSDKPVALASTFHLSPSPSRYRDLPSVIKQNLG